jgi:deazaflavin-dependent oxidoreductase (nitroreductase family)
MPQRGKSRKTVAGKSSAKKAVRKSSPSKNVKPAAKPVAVKSAAKPVTAKAKPAAAAEPRKEAQPKAARRLPRWMAEHLDSYLATNGAVGHLWRGMPTLLLTTTGRRSGEERVLPLLYGRDGNRYVVVASRGGAPDHPAWYKNLVDDPEVRVQVGSDRFRARARTANRDERPRLWVLMNKVFPTYDQYQAITRREIPVVIIERH